MNRTYLYLLAALMVAGTSANETTQDAPQPQPSEQSGPAAASPTVRQLPHANKALQRHAELHEEQIRRLVDQARNATGNDRAAIQRRIELLKSRQETEELQIQLELAIESKDDLRRRQLEAAVKELATPRPAEKGTREKRVLPAPAGGAR